MAEERRCSSSAVGRGLALLGCAVLLGCGAALWQVNGRAANGRISAAAAALGDVLPPEAAAAISGALETLLQAGLITLLATAGAAAAAGACEVALSARVSDGEGRVWGLGYAGVAHTGRIAGRGQCRRAGRLPCSCKRHADLWSTVRRRRARTGGPGRAHRRPVAVTWRRAPLAAVALPGPRLTFGGTPCFPNLLLPTMPPPRTPIRPHPGPCAAGDAGSPTTRAALSAAAAGAAWLLCAAAAALLAAYGALLLGSYAVSSLPGTGLEAVASDGVASVSSLLQGLGNEAANLLAQAPGEVKATGWCDLGRGEG
jgi:hypothetical protein